MSTLGENSKMAACGFSQIYHKMLIYGNVITENFASSPSGNLPPSWRQCRLNGNYKTAECFVSVLDICRASMTLSCKQTVYFSYYCWKNECITQLSIVVYNFSWIEYLDQPSWPIDWRQVPVKWIGNRCITLLPYCYLYAIVDCTTDNACIPTTTSDENECHSRMKKSCSVLNLKKFNR